jgi:hypothetical protein
MTQLPTAPAAPVAPGVATAPAQPAPTLDQLATGINQQNFDLQRQTNAFGYLRSVLALIDLTLQQPDPHEDEERARLPFISIRIPQDGIMGDEAPDVIEIDLNTVPVAQLSKYRPLFESAAGIAGERLLGAWDGVINLTGLAAPIIATAQGQQADATDA